MERLQLKQRQPVEEVECWDDDEDLQANDFHFRTTSIATTATSSHQSHHRESIASRLSIRSDLDSHFGDDDRQVILPGDDEAATVQAIASAINAGIPIPANTPTSALVGGTIKRLGGKKSRKIAGDDWGDDLEFPKIEDGALTIKRRDGSAFPDALRHVSGETAPQDSTIRTPQKSSNKSMMDRFRDDDDDDFLGDIPTIKVTKRTPRKPIPFTGPQNISFSGDGPPEDFEKDLEIPENGEPLKLSARKDVPKTPALNQDDFDEWAEGSLGTRHGGTRRDRHSGRSSSISAMSPSISSSFTAESEDDGLDGLILPAGPVDFKDILERRQKFDDNSPIIPKPVSQDETPSKIASTKDDFFSGLEIGDGNVFDSGKLSLNRNIKHKATRGPSPAKRTAMSITFTNKPTTTRLPRPRSGHERSSTSKLESVTETPDASGRSNRSHSRLGGHISSSPSAIPVPASTNPPTPSTPSRSRVLGTRPSMKTLRPEPTTTAAQLLKAKRSMPSMRSAGHSPSKVYTSSQRPPSRQDGAHRTNLPPRPKTPVERSGAESSLAHARRHPVPFLPAGTSHSQHVTAKTSRSFRRHDSESSAASGEFRSASRHTLSRTAMRSPSPKRKDFAPDSLAKEAAAKSKLTRPKGGRRIFGDGNELDLFDDLPTSTTAESKYVKQPVGRGAPRVLRAKLGQASIPDRSVTPAPSTASGFASPTKPDYTPRFARDTNASRIAREQRVGSSMSNHPPLAPVSTNWKAHIAARPVALGSPETSRSKRRAGAHHQTQSRPHLIKPLGDSYKNPKTDKGMQYNPALFRWEGNENVLAPFDAPIAPPTSISPVHPAVTPGSKIDRQVPALITNIGTTQGVQVHGGMVFDPIRMCWLKLSHHQKQQQQRSRASSSNPMSPIATATEDDEDSDDPFAGLDDLDDTKSRPGTRGADGTETKAALENDDWLVGEEFDVGPEFVRRQREEEERWRRKVERWVRPETASSSGGSSDDWRYAFQSLIPQN